MFLALLSDQLARLNKCSSDTGRHVVGGELSHSLSLVLLLVSDLDQDLGDLEPEIVHSILCICIFFCLPFWEFLLRCTRWKGAGLLWAHNLSWASVVRSQRIPTLRLNRFYSGLWSVPPHLLRANVDFWRFSDVLLLMSCAMCHFTSSFFFLCVAVPSPLYSTLFVIAVNKIRWNVSFVLINIVWLTLTALTQHEINSDLFCCFQKRPSDRIERIEGVSQPFFLHLMLVSISFIMFKENYSLSGFLYLRSDGDKWHELFSYSGHFLWLLHF